MEVDALPSTDPLATINRPQVGDRRHSHGVMRSSRTRSAQNSAHSTDNDLSITKTKSSTSSKSQRSRRPSTRSLDRGFTVEELSDEGDQGYDGDVEVVYPEGYDEPDTDDETNPFADFGAGANEMHLADRLRGLSFKARQPMARQKKPSKPPVRRHKRRFSESFASDSGPELQEMHSDPSSLQTIKRTKFTESAGLPSMRLSPATSEGLRPQSRQTHFYSQAQVHASTMDAMDVDQT